MPTAPVQPDRLYAALRGGYFVLLALALPGALLHFRLGTGEPLSAWILVPGLFVALVWAFFFFSFHSYHFPPRTPGAAASVAGLLVHAAIAGGLGGSLGFAAWQAVYAPLAAQALAFAAGAVIALALAISGRSRGYRVALAAALGAALLGAGVWLLRQPLLEQLAARAPKERLALGAAMLGHVVSEFVIAFRSSRWGRAGRSAGAGEAGAEAGDPSMDRHHQFAGFTALCMVGTVLGFIVAAAWPLGS